MDAPSQRISESDAPALTALEKRIATLVDFMQSNRIAVRPYEPQGTTPLTRVLSLNRKVAELEGVLFGWSPNPVPPKINETRTLLDELQFLTELLQRTALAVADKKPPPYEFGSRAAALQQRAQLQHEWAAPAVVPAPVRKAPAGPVPTWRPVSGQSLPVAVILAQAPNTEPKSLLAAIRAQTSREVVWVGADTSLLQPGQTVLLAVQPVTIRTPFTSDVRKWMQEILDATGKQPTLLVGLSQSAITGELDTWAGSTDFKDEMVQYETTVTKRDFVQWSTGYLPRLRAALA